MQTRQLVGHCAHDNIPKYCLEREPNPRIDIALESRKHQQPVLEYNRLQEPSILDKQIPDLSELEFRQRLHSVVDPKEHERLDDRLQRDDCNRLQGQCIVEQREHEQAELDPRQLIHTSRHRDLIDYRQQGQKYDNFGFSQQPQRVLETRSRGQCVVDERERHQGHYVPDGRQAGQNDILLRHQGKTVYDNRPLANGSDIGDKAWGQSTSSAIHYGTRPTRANNHQYSHSVPVLGRDEHAAPGLPIHRWALQERDPGRQFRYQTISPLPEYVNCQAPVQEGMYWVSRQGQDLYRHENNVPIRQRKDLYQRDDPRLRYIDSSNNRMNEPLPNCRTGTQSIPVRSTSIRPVLHKASKSLLAPMSGYSQRPIGKTYNVLYPAGHEVGLAPGGGQRPCPDYRARAAMPGSATPTIII